MINKKNINYLLQDYEEIAIRYEKESGSVWCYFNPTVRPSFTLKMMQEMYQFQLSMIEYFKANDMNPQTPVNYLIIASQTEDVFNYGGDLALFADYILNKEHKKLYDYAKMCIDIMYLNSVNMHLPITTISLVEGIVLGGGFEAALSSDYIIADESIKMGMPEIRFNLFPGMGAFSLLARKVGIKEAENILTSGQIYDASTLYEKGIIDILAPKGQAQTALDEFITKRAKSLNGLNAIQQTKLRYENLQYDEFLDITKIWVEAALKLKEKDLKVMKKLAMVQRIKKDKINMKLRTRQDRRIQNEPLSFPLLDKHGNSIEQDRRLNSDRRA